MVMQAKSLAIAFAVVSFYILDFALNGLQASLRNLLLDITPPGQLNAGNAWHGRMTNAGNIVGYGFGTSSNSLFKPTNHGTFIIQGSYLWLNYPL